jgi:hypothetical protein
MVEKSSRGFRGWLWKLLGVSEGIAKRPPALFRGAQTLSPKAREPSG